MFVFSLKANKKRLLIVLVILAAVLAVVFFAVSRDKPVVNSSGISYRASNEQERIAFLSQFGWDVNEDPVSVEEVVIPAQFDEVYSKYNQIQLTQGLDLSKYAGQTAKKWTYEVRNYPGYAADSNCIRANIIVYQGAVIGGDISSVEQGGFMQSFDYPQNQTQSISKNNQSAE